MENVEIRKVKHTSQGVEIDYEVEKQIGEDHVTKTLHTVKCKDQPHPEFSKCLQAFEEIVRFDEGYTKKAEIEITGVTFFPMNETFIVSHLKQCESGRVVRNSGRMSVETYAKGDDLATLFYALRNEAKAYVFEGKRAQLKIFDAEAA